ncbi:MAG: hypothetical protein FWC26_14610 [Fibromonadales bacterium]|nr:hypothetical protein [Fibromonadales bacterium]
MRKDRNYFDVGLNVRLRCYKTRLAEEGSQLLTICKQLKMIATDGKERLTDVATTEQIFMQIYGVTRNLHKNH